MDLGVLTTCLLIVCARIADVSLGTLRTMFMVQGRRGVAFSLGFFESLIWVYVVSSVVQNLSNPLYAVCFAGGFAAGNFIGITVEKWLGHGQQVVRVFSRQAALMAARLREEQYVVSEFDATGRDGPIGMLFLQTPRKKVPGLLRQVTAIDPASYYVVDDVRAVPVRATQTFAPTGWRGVLKKK